MRESDRPTGERGRRTPGRRGGRATRRRDAAALVSGRRVSGSDVDQDAVRIEGTGPDGAFPIAPTGSFSVSLQRSDTPATLDQPLWVAIRQGADAIRFEAFQDFINEVLCTKQEEEETGGRAAYGGRVHNILHGVNAYRVLLASTEAFLLAGCGLRIEEKSYIMEEEESRLGEEVSHAEIVERLKKYLGTSNDILPYLNRITRALETLPNSNPFCGSGVQVDLRENPCLLELIWSYWHEEGMLVQAIHAVSRRFQNKRGTGERDPLANLEIHPLRPLSNLLWGYIQDEDHRLTIARRTYEYEHHYGLSLIGKAVPKLRPADRRSKFLQAFNSLLHQVSLFYEKDADTTVDADGFTVLNGLREVHMLLAEGAHNQFRDLPWTARVEMLIQQWLLARPEMTEFLGGRASVPYAEDWMGTVDSLKRLFNWSDTPVAHFHDLAIYGEQILLSIRYADWSVENDQETAKNWARYWKPEIQRYIHAYETVTGVDLAASSADKQMGRKINATLPSLLIDQRLRQRAR